MKGSSTADLLVAPIERNDAESARCREVIFAALVARHGDGGQSHVVRRLPAGVLGREEALYVWQEGQEAETQADRVEQGAGLCGRHGSSSTGGRAVSAISTRFSSGTAGASDKMCQGS